MNKIECPEITEKVESKNHLVFAVLLVGCMICSFLQTALTTALPPIMQDFNISAATGQWLTSAYSLAMGIMIPATAFLIRRYSVKRLFLLFMSLFTVGLFLSASAVSFPILMLGRVFQALGCGILLSLTQVVILTIYPVNKRGTVMGIYGLAVGAIPVFAPTLAGMVVDSLGWQWIFLAAAVLSVLDIAAGIKILGNLLETVKQSFDIISMLFCAVGFCGLLFGLGNIGSYNFLSVYVAFPILFGCAFLVFFVIRQLNLKIPLLDMHDFKNREFRLSVIISMLMYTIMMAGSTLLPIYIQSMRGYSATFSGLVTIPGSLIMALISPFVGKIYDKMGIRKLLYAGSTLLLISCIGLTSLSDSTSMIYVAIMFFIRLLAIGLIMMPLATWGLSTIPANNTANGTALLTSLRTIAGAISSAVFVALMTMAAASPKNPNPELQIYGINVSFIAISVVAAVLFLMSIIFVRKDCKAVDIKQ